jgi:hypothetical protein
MVFAKKLAEKNIGGTKTPFCTRNADISHKVHGHFPQDPRTFHTRYTYISHQEHGHFPPPILFQ